MAILPLQLSFYKGMGGKHGALQFNVQKPHYYLKTNPKLKNFEGKFVPDKWHVSATADDLLSREGAVFLEACSATGKNVYDWDNKITVALSVNDIAKILMVVEGNEAEMKIMHDPGAKTATQGKVQKYLTIASPQGIKAGVLFRVAQSEAGDGTTTHQVPLNGDETKLLSVALRSVISVCLSWV